MIDSYAFKISNLFSHFELEKHIDFFGGDVGTFVFIQLEREDYEFAISKPFLSQRVMEFQSCSTAPDRFVVMGKEHRTGQKTCSTSCFPLPSCITQLKRHRFFKIHFLMCERNMILALLILLHYSKDQMTQFTKTVFGTVSYFLFRRTMIFFFLKKKKTNPCL